MNIQQCNNIACLLGICLCRLFALCMDVSWKWGFVTVGKVFAKVCQSCISEVVYPQLAPIHCICGPIAHQCVLGVLMGSKTFYPYLHLLDSLCVSEAVTVCLHFLALAQSHGGTSGSIHTSHQAFASVCAHVYMMPVYIHVYIYTYIHTYMYIHIHTYIRTYIYIQMWTDCTSWLSASR